MESQIVSPPFLKEITIKAATAKKKKPEEQCHERFISAFKKVTEPFVGAGLAPEGGSRACTYYPAVCVCK